MRAYRTVAALLPILTLAGCASTGMFPAVNLTTTQLAEGNFRVIATDVGGESSAAYILGFASSIGPDIRTSRARVSSRAKRWQTSGQPSRRPTGPSRTARWRWSTCASTRTC